MFWIAITATRPFFFIFDITDFAEICKTDVRYRMVWIMEWLWSGLFILVCTAMSALLCLFYLPLSERYWHRRCERALQVRFSNSIHCRYKADGSASSCYVLSWNDEPSVLILGKWVMTSHNPILMVLTVQNFRRRGIYVPLCLEECERKRQLSLDDKLTSCYLSVYDLNGYICRDEFTAMYNSALKDFLHVQSV